MANLRANKITGTEVFETTGSVQFDGSSSTYLTASSSDFAMGTGDFTVEGWVYQSGGDTTYGAMFSTATSDSSGTGIVIARDRMWVGNNTATYGQVSSTFWNLNEWTHVALTRSGTSLRAFKNGILVGTDVSTGDIDKQNLAIGRRYYNNTSFILSGHISNLRILKGTALYTKNFTPPTRELTVIPNTVLLCCQSTTRANEEKTGKTITVNGNAVANELTPGLLTDRIRSGGSSAISGSVEFDGTGDYLSLTDSTDFTLGTGNFTLECWAYFQASPLQIFLGQNTGNPSSSSIDIRYSAGTITGYAFSASTGYSATGSAEQNTWHHIAWARDGSTMRLFINGTQTGTDNISTNSINDSTTTFGVGAISVGYNMTGHLSNVRLVKGTALYTQNFIPPTRELKNLPGTVLLCCQNSKSATQEATGKTITVNGNATARYFTPPVGFDGFVNFDGATKIKTPNYFYLPTGTTEDRGRGRGLFGGGYVPGTSQNTIQYINIQSQGNAQDFGDLSSNMGSADGKAPCAAASATRALFASGYSAPGPVNTIEYVTISTTSNSTDFGDLTTNRRDLGACSSSTRALFGGGTTTGSTSATNVIEYVTIASLGNAVSFGTLTQARRAAGSCASPTRGIWGGGYVSNSPATYSNRIDYVTIATTGNATTFGDLSTARNSVCSLSSSIRGIFAGGSTVSQFNTIEYISIASLGNAVSFGSLTAAKAYISTSSNSIRGVFAGGTSGPASTNTIEFVLIASTGNATDFGDLLAAAQYYNSGCSDSHGGLG